MSSIHLFDTGVKLSNEILYILIKGQKRIAECIVFKDDESDKERKVNFSYIQLCDEIPVEECVDIIIEYAQYNKFRLIEYPLLRLYNDGTFFRDNLKIKHNEYDEVEIENDNDYQDVLDKNNKTSRNDNPSVSFNVSEYVLRKYESTNRIQVTHGKDVDTYATYQILPNIVPYISHQSSVSMSIGKCEAILNDEKMIRLLYQAKRVYIIKNNP
jgi:hypothetical protein